MAKYPAKITENVYPVREAMEFSPKMPRGEVPTDRFPKEKVYEACKEFLGGSLFDALMFSSIPMFKIMDLAMSQAIDEGIDLEDKRRVRHFDNLRIAMRFTKVMFK